MLKAIQEKLDAAKFVPDLKTIIADLAQAVDARLDKIEAIVQSGPVLARGLDLHDMNDLGPIQRLREEETAGELLEPPAPAEAATDAPSDGEEKHGGTEGTENTAA